VHLTLSTLYSNIFPQSRKYDDVTENAKLQMRLHFFCDVDVQSLVSIYTGPTPSINYDNFEPNCYTNL